MVGPALLAHILQLAALSIRDQFLDIRASRGEWRLKSHDHYIPEDLPTLLFGRKAANSELVFN